MADCSPASAWVLATIVALSLTCALARAHDNLVVGVCEDGAQVKVPVQHDLPASMYVLDAELRRNSTEIGVGEELVLLTVVEDILSKPIWGLYSANPAAKFLKIEIQLGSSTFECQTVTKANKIAGNLLTSMVFITCPAPSQLIEGGEARHHLIVRSNPSRGDSIVPLCAWNQHQVPISNVSADIEFPTLAICVRPFRPYFFGTTMPSISKEQVSAWVKHHLAEGIDRIYLYDYYEAGDGLGDPTLKNYLEASDIPVDIGPRAADERVNIRRMRFLSDKTSTFDALITKSYIYDQMPVMEQCFMQARREGISHVLHIDFDEYMHYRPTNETFSIKSALSVAGKLCTDWDFSLDQTKIKGVVIPRRTVTHANFDTDLGFLESNTWGGSKLAAQRRRHLLFQGWGLANKQNDVKTAFNVNVLRPSDPYSVHQPYSTMWEEEDLCLADLNRTTHIWMNHLVDAYAKRSELYTYKSYVLEDLGNPTVLVPELPAVLLFAFVSSALLVAWRVWCLYRNVESKDKSLQLPLLSGSRSPPRIRSHPGSIYKTYAAPASYRQLAVAVVCCIALWVLVEFSFNILLTKNQDMQPNPSPSSNRDLKFHSALPSQVYAGQKVTLEFSHGKNSMANMMRHVAYMWRLVDGPEHVAAHVNCDFNHAEMPVPCVAEFSVCFPGEYELQLWHWERDATRNETSLPDKADVWRQDARLKQLLLSHRMSVVVTNEKAVSPDAFPECLKEEKDGFRMGHWVDINCTDAPSAALVIRDPAVLHEVCKDRSVLYTNPRGLTWKKFPDWLTFFAYLQPRPDSHIYTKTVWVPPITNQAPPLNVKQMARGLGRTWVHISGDSVGFEEFAAIFSLMKLNPGGENTRLVCARPRDELSSSYLEFAPCMDILDKRNSSASERIDRESQHTWLWMASLPDQGIYFSYSYGLNAEIVVYLNAEVEQTSPRPLRKILSVMHGLHHTNQIIPQYEYKSVSPMGALTVREGELVTGVLHTAAEMMRPSSGYRIFDKAMISSPTSTALDIQSWGMDLASLKHMAMQQQRWAEAAGFVFVDSLGFSLPLAWSSEDSDGAYIDNVHFAGELLWGYAEWKLNIFARVASQT